MPGTESAANLLVLEHLAWARRLAGYRARQLRGMEAEEIVAVGIEGLVQASRSWSQDVGVPFRGYARHRIHGAISDMLRRHDTVDRRALSYAEKQGLGSWAERRGYPRRVAMSHADRVPSPGRQEDAAELALVIRRIRALPPRLAYVAGHYFLRGEKLVEIGAQLGVTEARACQLLKEAEDLLPLRDP